jgi:hypothetical protein
MIVCFEGVASLTPGPYSFVEAGGTNGSDRSPTRPHAGQRWLSNCSTSISTRG